jgi:predicted dehydrogenase
MYGHSAWPTRRAILQGFAVTAATPPLKLPGKVRVVIVGLEGHPEEIVSPLDSMPDVEVVAIAGPEAELARFRGQNARLSAVKQYGDYRRMLDVEKPDVVAVCNTDGARAAAVAEAAGRRLNVIAEKPLATNQTDFARIRKTVSENGVSLGMLLPMRYQSEYRALQRLRTSGELGDVIQISAQKSYKLGSRPDWFKHRDTYGSTILWIGPHMIDLMRWTSGRTFVEVASFMGRVGYAGLGDMETTTTTSFRLDNGGTATLHMDYCQPETAPSHGDDRLRIAGTEGVAEYIASTGVTVVTRNRKLQRMTALPEGGSVFRDYIAHTYAGAAATLALEDIYAVCESTIAAHDSAVEKRVVRI